MGGGRTAEGTAVYKRVEGKYVRVAPYKRNPNSKNQEPQVSLADRRKNATEAISQATNKKELQSAMESLGLGDKTSFINEIKDFESAKDIATGIAEMNEVFGSEYLSDVTTQGTFPSGVQGYTFPGEYTLHLNGKEYNDRAALEGQCYLESTMGYSYKNESPASIVMHEYAHLLQNKLCERAMNSDHYKELREEQRRAQASIDRLTADHPKEWAKATKWLNKAIGARDLASRTKYVTKTMEAMEGVLTPVQHRLLFNNVKNVLSTRQSIGILLTNEAVNKIGGIFNRLGYSAPNYVAKALTGNPRAYARMNWKESHAECIADYMTNGENASAVSIAYVEAFAKEIGVNLK